MKAITLFEPWATLFLSPEKQWETRSWQTSFRGCLAVHTSARLPAWARELCAQEPFKSALARCGIHDPSEFRLGQVIGAVNLTGIVPTEYLASSAAVDLPKGSCELTFGDYTPGRFAWGRSPDVFRLEETIVCPGARMLWRLPSGIERQVRKEMIAAGWPHMDRATTGECVDFTARREHFDPSQEALFNIETVMPKISTTQLKPGETEFEVLQPITWHTRSLVAGDRFRAKKTSPRSGADLTRWLTDGKIKEVEPTAAPAPEAPPTNEVAQPTVETANAPKSMTAMVASVVEIERIRPDPTNPRKDFSPDLMAELVSSVRAEGVLHPITIRVLSGEKHLYEIVAGERRWRAAKEAGHTQIPAFIHAFSDEEAAVQQAIENLQRVDLAPMEEARGYTKLLAFGWDVEKISQRTGKARNTIYDKLKLLEAPEPVQQAVENELLSASTAVLIARQDSQVQQKTIAALLPSSDGVSAEGEKKPVTHAEARQTIKQIKQDDARSLAYDREKARMEALGCTVLEGKEAEGVISYNHMVDPLGEYVDANILCKPDPMGRTWKELLKDAPTVRRLAVVANAWRGWIGVEIFDKKEVMAALKERGLLAPMPEVKKAPKPIKEKAAKPKPKPTTKEEPARFQPGERQAVAIKEAKQLAWSAYEENLSAKDSINALSAQIAIVQSTDDSPELKLIQERIHDLHRLFNAQELGSFHIRVNRAMEEAWGRLP